MARTFPAYKPTVLKLTSEQLAKVPTGLEVKFGINRVKQKNGAIYVTERAYPDFAGISYETSITASLAFV